MPKNKKEADGLALDGYVYDVSAGREEYYNKGKPYHELVGKDSSQMLHIAGADLIRKKYPVVGIYTP
jgi:predicted heme/steroid binding protein